jgi:tetratricopeptide (TPR) repeat protein
MTIKRLLFMIALAAPVAARAQDQAIEAAKTHFENAQDLFADGKYQEAAAEFQAAFDIKGFPAFLYNEAVCYEKLNNGAKALQLYKQYLSIAPNSKDAADVQKKVDYLQGEIDHKTKPDVKPPSPPPAPTVVKGLVVVESNPPGATVYVDDKAAGSVGETPWSGSLQGKHTIILEAQGYKTEKKEVEPKGDRMLNLYMSMSEEHSLAFIDIRSNVVGADVYIDDESGGRVGTTPYLGNLTPQKHKLVVTKEGYTRHEEELDMQAGKAYKIDAQLQKAPVGFLAFKGDIQGARVSIDGKVVCDAAPCRVKSDDGDHKVTVSMPGKKPFERRIHVAQASETDIAVTLMPKQGHADAIWNFAFAAAIVGGGIALGIEGNAVHDQLKKDIDAGMPPVLPSDGRFLKGQLFAVGADVLFGVGGIVAITGVVSLLKDKGPASTGQLESRDLSVAPAVGPGYEGVSAEVRW